ncbi:MAG: SPW repeat protein [Deinococcales bacterium]|jgi:hypothetical protein
MRFTRRWQEWVSLIAGAWLFVSPWILGYTGVTVAAWGAYVLGAAVVVAALWAMTARQARNPEYIGALLGALVFISPWVLGYTAERIARLDAWIVGAVIVVASLWAAMNERPARPPERRGPAA